MPLLILLALVAVVATWEATKYAAKRGGRSLASRYENGVENWVNARKENGGKAVPATRAVKVGKAGAALAIGGVEAVRVAGASVRQGWPLGKAIAQERVSGWSARFAAWLEQQQQLRRVDPTAAARAEQEAAQAAGQDEGAAFDRGYHDGYDGKPWAEDNPWYLRGHAQGSVDRHLKHARALIPPAAPTPDPALPASIPAPRTEQAPAPAAAPVPEPEPQPTPEPVPAKAPAPAVIAETPKENTVGIDTVNGGDVAGSLEAARAEAAAILREAQANLNDSKEGLERIRDDARVSRTFGDSLAAKRFGEVPVKAGAEIADADAATLAEAEQRSNSAEIRLGLAQQIITALNTAEGARA